MTTSMSPSPGISASDSRRRTAVIVGAGPAGLTAACELLRSTDMRPVVMEATGHVGGLSRTVNHHGNRMDIGGHRFFSKSGRVLAWWARLMPVSEDPDDRRDAVMLRRRRVSRIYYLRRFFDYPVSLCLRTFAGLGLRRTLSAGAGYLWSRVRPRNEASLEDFYINRFGRPLYRMFFEDYTEKVWGLHPSRLGADWGAQRIKGLSVSAIIKDMLARSLRLRDRKVETSLIEEFIYPKFGPGQLWEAAAREVTDGGGALELHTTVERVHLRDGRVVAVTSAGADGHRETVSCDCLLSSMPVKDLIAAMEGIDIPDDVRDAAAGLPYRDFITVGLLVKRLAIRNTTSRKTYKDRVPDTWIYVQERDVSLGRIQIFNNWSPYMVADNESTEWIGLEYFCNEGDRLWTMSDEEFISMAIEEVVRIGVVASPDDIIDSVRIKMPKAYPAYHGTYGQLDAVRRFLDSIPNLFCIGRNGQHRYNNMDHSMLTAMEAVDAIAAGSADRSAVWAVNTDTDYHEAKR